MYGYLYITEQFAALEWLKSTPVYQKSQLYYWLQESKNSHTEIDYILQDQQHDHPARNKNREKILKHDMRKLAIAISLHVNVTTVLSRPLLVPCLKLSYLRELPFFLYSGQL